MSAGRVALFDRHLKLSLVSIGRRKLINRLLFAHVFGRTAVAVVTIVSIRESFAAMTVQQPLGAAELFHEASSTLAEPPPPPPAPPPRRIIPLGPNELAVQTAWGGWVVVPTFNLDVALGPIRDGVIEPWTTRLVQETLRHGDTYLNAGGNFGYYVALGGSIVCGAGRVIGIEPNPYILPFLMKTTYWCGWIGITEIYRAALWHEAGREVEFMFDPQYLGGGTANGVWRGGFGGAVRVADASSAIWSAANMDGLFDAQGKWMKDKGIFVPFKTTTQTIDAIVGGARVDVIHLDIEGAEPFALLGAKETIRSNPGLKLITEWSSNASRQGSAELKAAVRDVFTFMGELGYRARYLEPWVAPDGGISMTDYLDFEWLDSQAPHGDYLWTRT